MTQWTCLDCGTEYNGTFSDNCPGCKSGRAIINTMAIHLQKPDLLSGEQLKTINNIEVVKPNLATIMVIPPESAVNNPQPVSKIYRSSPAKHIGKGRPRIYLTSDQLTLADNQEIRLSLRARATILGVSPATVLRMDRRKTAEKVK